MGNWVRGKQHGIGCYIQAGEEQLKYGLWEDGKRVKWFSYEEVALIKKGKLDYTEFYNNPHAHSLDTMVGFEPQEDFIERINFVKRRIAEISAAI